MLQRFSPTHALKFIFLAVTVSPFCSLLLGDTRTQVDSHPSFLFVCLFWRKLSSETAHSGPCFSFQVCCLQPGGPPELVAGACAPPGGMKGPMSTPSPLAAWMVGGSRCKKVLQELCCFLSCKVSRVRAPERLPPPSTSTPANPSSVPIPQCCFSEAAMEYGCLSLTAPN